MNENDQMALSLDEMASPLWQDILCRAKAEFRTKRYMEGQELTDRQILQITLVHIKAGIKALDSEIAKDFVIECQKIIESLMGKME